MHRMVDRFSVEALALLVEEANEVGRFLLERQPGVTFNYKPDGTVLSELDEQVQHRMYDRLTSLPDDSLRRAHFVGEESLAAGGFAHELKRGAWNWVVDALDGTAAYTKGFNVFAISIALLDGDFNPLIGLVHVPGMMGRFDLVSAHGGTLQRFEVTRGDGVQFKPVDAAIAPPEGWPALEVVRRSYCYGSSDLHRRLPGFIGKVRNLGATATHLALLADHSSDPAAVMLSRCHIWDVAAGLALAEAAGIQTRRLRQAQPLNLAEIAASEPELPLPLIVGHSSVLDTIQAELKPLEPE